MGRTNFDIGKRFEWHGERYVVTDLLLDNKLEVKNISSGGRSVEARLTLVQGWAQGDLVFLGRRGPNANTTGLQKSAAEYTFADFTCLPAGHRAEAWRRYQLILPLLLLTPRERSALLKSEESEQRLSACGDGKKERRARVSRGEADSARSKKRWLKAFVESGYERESLVPALTHRKPDKDDEEDPHPFTAILDTILAEHALSELPTSVPDVRLELLRRLRVRAMTEGRKDEGAAKKEAEDLCPSESTVLRYIKDKKIQWILRSRPGAMDAHGQETAVQPGPRPTRILERVEFDGTPLDLMVVDDVDRLPIGRPYLTVGIDVASRYIWGYHAGWEPDDFQSVRSCMLNGIPPKPEPGPEDGNTHRQLSYGVPELGVLDNGKKWTGVNMTDAAMSIGMIVDECPVRAPWEKGTIESFFRTQSKGLGHQLPGTTFASLFERGDYDPMKHACISLTAFRRLLRIFLFDVYGRRKHRGTAQTPGGPRRTPEALWREGEQAHPPDLQHNAEDVRIWLLNTEWRTIQSTGVDLYCLRYQSSALTPLRNSHGTGFKFKVKIDYDDLSHIYVLDPDANKRPIRVPITKPYQEYAKGLSMHQHTIIKDYAKRTTPEHEIDEHDLADAKHRIRQIVEEEFALTGKAKRTRRRLAQYLGKGKEGTVFAGIDALTTPTAITPPAPVRRLPAPTTVVDMGAEGEANNATPEARLTDTRATKGARQHQARAATSGRRTREDVMPAAPATVDEVPPVEGQRSPQDAPVTYRLATREGWGGDHHLPKNGRPNTNR